MSVLSYFLSVMVPCMPVVTDDVSHQSVSNDAVSAGSTMLSQFWRKLSRQKTWFLSILLGVLALTALLNWLITPQYRSVSTLEILQNTQVVEPDKPNGTEINKTEANLSFYTQAEQLKSRGLAEKVIDQLDLRERLFRHDFDPPLKQSMKMQASYMSAPFKSLYGAAQSPERDYVGELLGQLVVEPVEKTRLIRVSYESPDPELSAQIANSYVKTFIHEAQTRDIRDDTYVETLLGMELETARKRLLHSEEALADYAGEGDSQSDDQASEDEQSQASYEKKLGELDTAFNVAKQRRAELERQLARVHLRGNADGSLKSSTIEALQQQLNELEADYAEKADIFKPAYPDMQDMDKTIERVEQQVDTATDDLIVLLESKLETTARLEDELKAEVSSLSRLSALSLHRGEPGEIDNNSAEYRVLQQEVDTNRKLYENLQERKQMLESRAGTSVTTKDKARLVDLAEPVRDSVSPDTWRNMFFGLLVGLGLATLFASVRAALSNSLYSADEIQSVSGLPVLGRVPFIKKSQRSELALAAVRDVGSATAEAYRQVAINMRFSMPGQGSKPYVALVTGVNPEEGKSTSSVNLALSQAQMGNKVLLIDADLRRPSVHLKMDLNNHLGLTEYLYGDAALSKITRHFDEMRDTYVITSGLLKLDPVEALSSEKMAELITMARTYFDVTIIDAPPITGFADSLLLAEMADATVLVTSEKVDDKQQLTRVLGQLRRSKQQTLGFLVVGAREGVVGNRYYEHYRRRTTEVNKPQIPLREKELNLVRKNNVALG